MVTRAVGAAAFASAALAAENALACPACASRGGGGIAFAVLIGAMILTPYLVSTVVLRVIRKVEAERAREEVNASGTAEFHN